MNTDEARVPKPLDHMSAKELIQVVDRSNAEVRALVWYLDRYIQAFDELKTKIGGKDGQGRPVSGYTTGATHSDPDQQHDHTQSEGG